SGSTEPRSPAEIDWLLEVADGRDQPDCPELAARRGGRPGPILGTGGGAASLVPALGPGARLAAADVPLVCRGPDEPQLQLPGRARGARLGRARGADRRERARRAAGLHLRSAPVRGEARC